MDIEFVEIEEDRYVHEQAYIFYGETHYSIVDFMIDGMMAISTRGQKNG